MFPDTRTGQVVFRISNWRLQLKPLTLIRCRTPAQMRTSPNKPAS